jgi:hypothetical protein
VESEEIAGESRKSDRKEKEAIKGMLLERSPLRATEAHRVSLEIIPGKGQGSWSYLSTKFPSVIA